MMYRILTWLLCHIDVHLDAKTEYAHGEEYSYRMSHCPHCGEVVDCFTQRGGRLNG